MGVAKKAPLPVGSLAEEELAPELMDELCLKYNTDFDGRFVTNFNLRDDGGHTPLWLAAAWGWESCVAFLLTLPQVHPLLPDMHGVTPEQTARRVGFHEIADAIKIRANELGVNLPDRAYWDEPDKRFYVKAPDVVAVVEDESDDEPME